MREHCQHSQAVWRSASDEKKALALFNSGSVSPQQWQHAAPQQGSTPRANNGSRQQAHAAAFPLSDLPNEIQERIIAAAVPYPDGLTLASSVYRSTVGLALSSVPMLLALGKEWRRKGIINHSVILDEGRQLPPNPEICPSKLPLLRESDLKCANYKTLQGWCRVVHVPAKGASEEMRERLLAYGRSRRSREGARADLRFNMAALAYAARTHKGGECKSASCASCWCSVTAGVACRNDVRTDGSVRFCLQLSDDATYLLITRPCLTVCLVPCPAETGCHPRIHQPTRCCSNKQHKSKAKTHIFPDAGCAQPPPCKPCAHFCPAEQESWVKSTTARKDYRLTDGDLTLLDCETNPEAKHGMRRYRLVSFWAPPKALFLVGLLEERGTR